MTEVAGAIGRGGVFFPRPQCSMILTALAASANANLPSPQYTRNGLESMPGSCKCVAIQNAWPSIAVLTTLRPLFHAHCNLLVRIARFGVRVPELGAAIGTRG